MKTYFQKSFFLLLILWVGLLPTMSFAQELGSTIKIFYGTTDGQEVKVKILRLGEFSQEEFLIQVSGVDDPINNHIYKYKREWQTSDKKTTCTLPTRWQGINDLLPFMQL